MSQQWSNKNNNHINRLIVLVKLDQTCSSVLCNNNFLWCLTNHCHVLNCILRLNLALVTHYKH